MAHAQQTKPDDFVIATGHQTTVRHFIELAAVHIGWGSIIWSGQGVDEVGNVLIPVILLYALIQIF